VTLLTGARSWHFVLQAFVAGKSEWEQVYMGIPLARCVWVGKWVRICNISVISHVTIKMPSVHRARPDPGLSIAGSRVFPA
jgi:hypothetical protein